MIIIIFLISIIISPPPPSFSLFFPFSLPKFSLFPSPFFLSSILSTKIFSLPFYLPIFFLPNPHFPPGRLRGLPDAPGGTTPRGRDPGKAPKLQPPPLLKPRSSEIPSHTTPERMNHTFGHFILFRSLCGEWWNIGFFFYHLFRLSNIYIDNLSDIDWLVWLRFVM